MGRFRNLETGVVVSVDDEKDARFESGWEPAESEPKASGRKSASNKKSD